MWLDKVIEVFAPRAGLERAKARFHIDQIRKYDAGKVSRSTSGWAATDGGPNTEIGPDLVRIRARTRDLIRNNDHAKAASRALVSGAVGSGIRIEPAVKYERDPWLEWANSRNCDYANHDNFAGLTRLVCRTWYEAGECLVRQRTDPNIGLQLQILEPDHLDHSKTMRLDDGFIMLGVEYSNGGKPRAYWLHPNHPGEMATISNNISVRIPADEILHIFDRERAAQVRGISRLVTTVLRFRDVADYQQALQVRKKIESCFAAFVTSDGDRGVGAVDENAPPSQTGLMAERLSPGMIQYLKPGEGVAFGTPSTSSDDGFLNSQLHAIAAGIGVTYAQLTGDLSQTNYSSMRGGMLEFRAMIEQDQLMVLVPQFIAPVRDWFRAYSRLLGQRVGAKKNDAITMPKKAWVDPLKDTQATKEMIRGGLTTQSEALRELGWASIDEWLDEVVAEREKMKARGVIVDTDPANEIPFQDGDPADETDAPGDPVAPKPKPKPKTPKSGATAKT